MAYAHAPLPVHPIGHLMAPRFTVVENRIGPLILFPLAAVLLLVLLHQGAGLSPGLFALPLAAAAGLAILRQPRLGLLALIVAALAIPLQFGTGTEVYLNPAALLVPALLGLWLLAALLHQPVRVPSARCFRPLVLFLVASLLSLAVGQLTWDSAVPRKDNFVLVQMAQWAIFAFSAGAFWLGAGLNQRWLQRMTVTFLAAGSLLALLRVVPALQPFFAQVSTGAVDRAPFWLLLSALAGGQLLFGRRLSLRPRLALLLVLALSLYYPFVLQREETFSTWVGVAAAGGMLIWLRFPRARAWLLTAAVGLGAGGVLFSAIWNLAGGSDKWDLSGGSRLVLIERVLSVAMRNPLTGLGPAAYRPYANQEPIFYQGAYWVAPLINSHNNYVDLFAHGGILGLVLFFWFAAEVGVLGMRLLQRYREDFAGGYVAGMLAAGAASLVIMALADWMLPFVYNIGFHGFQASVLVWLFLGGLVALDNQPDVAATAPAGIPGQPE